MGGPSQDREQVARESGWTWSKADWTLGCRGAIVEDEKSLDCAFSCARSNSRSTHAASSARRLPQFRGQEYEDAEAAQMHAMHDSSIDHDVSLRWALPVGAVKLGLLAAARASMRVGRPAWFAGSRRLHARRC